jgi:hypothetical protein
MNNSIGIQIVKLNPISEKKTTKERMRGKRKPPEEKCKEEYPEARGWSENDFRAGGESFRRIILQKADLLDALQLLLQELGLDPVTDGGHVGVRGLGLFHGGAGGGTGGGRAPLAHDGGAQLGTHRNGRKDAMQERSARRKMMMVAEWGK